MATEANTGQEFWASGAIQQDLLFNGLLRYIGAHVKVQDKDLNTPPAHVAGNTYIVGSAPTGAWASKANYVAYSDGTSWWFYAPYEGLRLPVLDEDVDYRYSGSAWVNMGGSNPVASVNGDTAAVIVLAPIIVACSDETTALTSGTAKVTFRMPYQMTLTEVPRASLTTAQTSGTIVTVDINEGGASILSTKLTIDNGEKTSTTAAAAAVLSDTTLANDAEVTIDIDLVGDGTAKGLKVTLIGYAS